MMREILFRGKTQKGEWVFGYLGVFKGVSQIFVPFTDEEEKANEGHIFSAIGGLWHTVFPETIGQYTGLTDKKGKRIFEGDIVEGHCHSQWSHRLQRCVIEYDRDGFEARHYVEQGGVMRYYSYKVLFSKDVVVIGNIHDNPELMEGGER